jgi:hypothetical protein
MYPPQAFTREMLSQAFVWLQAQPEPVPAQASNPESLIALYLKAQRSQMHLQKKMDNQSPNPQTDAPVSAQNFMTDLKSLAEGLKQFDDPRANGQTHVASHFSHAQQQAQQYQQPFGQVAHQAPQVNLPPPPNQQAPQQVSQHQVSTGLNPNSIYMIREVKEKFNLNSDVEAINMLVAIAYKNLKSLIE